MKARWYDPQAGRFLSVDPVIRDVAHPQSHNGYSYVENEPINTFDPWGLQGLGPEPGDETPCERACQEAVKYGSVSSVLPLRDGNGNYVSFTGALIAPGSLQHGESMALASGFRLYRRPMEDALPQGNYIVSSASTPESFHDLLLFDRQFKIDVAMGSVKGFLSAPRGIYRFFRHEARRDGLLGLPDQLAVLDEDLALGLIMQQTLQHPEVVVLGVEHLAQSPEVGGRIFGRALFTTTLGALLNVPGFALGMTAEFGDAFYAIEVGTQTAEGVLGASLTGFVEQQQPQP